MEVVLADGSRVLLDAGTGIRVAGHAYMQAFDGAGRSNASPRPSVTVILTHRHSDHVNGLAHFAPLLSQTHRLRIACNEVSTGDLRSLVTQQLSAPLFPTIGGVIDAVDIDAFDATNTLRISPTLRVRALMANHPGGASVLLVEDNHGPLVAYAPDNELAHDTPDPSILEWRTALADALRDVPVLIHDATYAHDELHRHSGWGHSSADEATDFAVACNAGRLLLTHHHPDRSDDDIDEMVRRCVDRVARNAHPVPVAAAADGHTYDIT